MGNYDTKLLSYFDNMKRQLQVRPLILGGTSGGTGGPPGGFIGYLPQTRVSYDETEAESLGYVEPGAVNESGVLVSGSLLDNMNHIRYRIAILEGVAFSGAGFSNLIIEDETNIVSSGVTVINFEGAGVVATQDSPGQVTVTISGGGTGSAHTIQEEGTPLTQRTGLNFIGTNVTATDDAANDRTNVTIASPTVGHVIQDEGTPETQRANLNFVGNLVSVSDDSGNDATVVTISGGSVSGHEIQDDGTPETQRSGLNFTGPDVAVADDSGNDRTNVTISGVHSLGDLDNVDFSTPPTDTQVLSYDDGSSSWIPATVSGSGGGYTECCRVRLNGDQTVLNDTYDSLSFYTEDYDTDTMHDNSTYPQRITCRTAGKYHVTANIELENDTGGTVRAIEIRLNGTTAYARDHKEPPTASLTTMLHASTDIDLSVNDYIEVYALQDSGGLMYAYDNGLYTSVFMAHRVG